MNWRRGLARLWLIVTAAWMVTITISLNPIAAVLDPIGAFPNQLQITQLRAGGFGDNEIASFARFQELTRFTEWLLTPPILLLVFGLAMIWAAQGFRRPQRSK